MTGSDDAPNRIIAAAERLFAEGGEEATSLRAITRSAQVNVAAIHYHFGGRDDLLRAVLDRKLAPLNARRLHLLDEAVATHREPVPVDALLRAFLRPDLELIARLRESGQVRFCRFMGRAYGQPGPAVAGFMQRQFEPVAARLYPLLAQALPELPLAELQMRMRLVVAVVTALFADATSPGEPGPLGTDDIDGQLTRLVAFLAAGLTAPTTQPPGPSVDRAGHQPNDNRRYR
jgi:AcrR family transcriptional regulator